MGAGVSSRLPIALSSTLALALAVAAGPACALGLGQLQVKSRPGQPLVAEIPIISSDPSELQGLQVQLASPETFRRVGLEPPQGAASALHFEPALDAGGRPVIRVTSATPVQQPLLTFLLEVDWGQGRLVREYSALLDAPRTVAAPVQAPIQAPVVAPSNTIVRAPTPVAVAPRPAPAATTPAPVKAPARPIPPAAHSAAPALPPAAASVASEPASPAPSQQAAGEYGPVRAGQTLGQIAVGLEGTQGYSLAQTMLALLRANPDAFIGGNINQLKRGAVLRIPPSDELARLDQRHAAALVHEQITQWREARRPLAQPSAVATSARPAPAAAPQVAAATAKPATRTADARLEIVPPSSAAGRQAGANNQANRSGIEAGGEGEMLRQQLQETKETLAARDAEVNELKTRVADLEKLQQQQQQLLTMKDSALAAAQQRLASTNQKAAAPVAATATTQAQPPAPQPEARGTSVWLWGGVVLVLTALVGWLLTRRRPAPVAPRRSFDTETLAAGMAAAAATGRDGTDAEAPKPAIASKPGIAVPPWHEGPEVPELAALAPTDAGQQLELAQKYLALGDDDAARALLRDVLNGRDPAARDRAARLLRDL